jgi:hypothetical protein
MHESARLNVFLGVRNLNAEWLPPHLSYLKGFLRKRSMNPLFPVSITIGTSAAVLLGLSAIEAETGSFEAVGMTLLAALACLAMFEHWLMILPLPTNWMWRWGLGDRDLAAKKADVIASAPVAPVQASPATVGRSL